MKRIWLSLLTAAIISSGDAANMHWTSPPEMLSTSNQNASTPQMATAANGNLVAVWVENGVVKASINTGQSSWSSAVSISGASSSSPCVVSDPSGNVIAIWNEGGTIKASSHPSGGN